MKVHYSVRGLELTSDLEKYANSKLMRLSRKIPRQLRPTAGWDVAFVLTVQKGIKVSSCCIGLTVGGVEFKAEESTQHLYAAFDIATVHIEQQLEAYARQQQSKRLGRFWR